MTQRETFLPHLDHLLKFVFDNPHSSFYRAIYERAGFLRDEALKPENFSKLPFVAKDDLVNTPPDDRLFVEKRDIAFTAYTSGTTAQKPLVLFFSEVENYYFEPSLGLDIERPLIAYAPLNKNFGHTFIQQCRQAKRPVTPVFGDFQNLANSAVLAHETNADAMYATPTVASLLAPEMEKYYDPSRIKLLALGSETLTVTRRHELSQKYPNAKIANVYASAEIGQFILYPCTTMINEGRDAFHVLHEAVDCVELIENELVITYSLNKAMPLIRYRTGDYFKEEAACSCGIPGPVLSWMGRLNVDRIRVAGVEITVDGVERTLADFRHLIGDQYQVHFYANSEGGKEIIRIVIEVLDLYPFGSRNLGTIANEVVRSLPDTWRISSSATLRDAMEKGLFMVPEIKFVKEFSEHGIKMRRLVNHL